MTHTKNTLQLALVAALIAALAGCSSGTTSPAAPVTTAAQGVEVRVDPSSETIARGAQTQLNALVTGTAVSTVTWSIVEPGTVGTVTQTGLYTAPTTATGTFHVRATSTVDQNAYGDAAVTVVAATCTSYTYSAWGTCTNGTQTRTVLTSTPTGCSGGVTPVLSQSCSVACTSYTYSAWGTCTNGTQSRTILTSVPSGCTGGASPVLSQSCTVAPVTVTLSPKTTTVDACTQRTFTASVANTSNVAVNWSVQEVGGGSVSNGVYTAPSMAGTYHVVATSVVDPTAIDTATVTVGDKVLSVTVAPASATIAPGASQQFVATIRTTCTTYTSSTQ